VGTESIQPFDVEVVDDSNLGVMGIFLEVESADKLS
jgi:hypothetical protein